MEVPAFAGMTVLVVGTVRDYEACVTMTVLRGDGGEVETP
jgi:hypothetical protein